MAPPAESFTGWGEPEQMMGQRRRRELRVGIIGAGVSGLTTCKHFLEQGLNVTVFEAKSGLGGVWRSTYATTKLQTPKQGYQFSDFPWPEDVPNFPSHHQVVDYLESYATRFGILERIHFNSKVLSLARISRTKFERVESVGGRDRGVGRLRTIEEDEETKSHDSLSHGIIRRRSVERADDYVWEVYVRRTISASDEFDDCMDEWYEFDYLVMCCGRFGDVPRVPSFPPFEGPEIFEGRVLHVVDYCSLDASKVRDLVAGKKVVVVGFQKTSLDIAVEVAEANQEINGPPCTMVFRRTHWMYPRHRQAFGYIPFGFFWNSRLASFWTSKPDQGLLQRVLQSIFSPVRSAVWKMIEYYLRFTLPLSRFGLVPEHALFQDLSACVLPQVPVTLFQHLEAGRIQTQKTPYMSFYPKGLRLADGTDLEADSVILCTGYNGDAKLKSILPKEYKDVLLEPGNVLTLYRGIIHPHIPNMGFIGYSEGLSSVHSSEIGAQWLAQLLRKSFTLPSIAEMETERAKWLQHSRSTTPFFNRPCLAPWQIWHTDKLCRDMGRNQYRKRSWWQEMFYLYSNNDYNFSNSLV
ncbi:hypothetical protein R1sor_002260 [Riccia sorocarpa]|uniref:Flavin-containing monooxygenase n=1 Tax=Riccia sorocarpa TaxID=122646 RepID=A0ABD3GYM8_9MARC